MMTTQFDKYSDVIDSRDGSPTSRTTTSARTPRMRSSTRCTGIDYAEDWLYGAQLIRDSYFTEYAQELADDIGAINSDAGWPNSCIDWDQAARELKQDYTSIAFDGVTYWVR